MTLSQSDRDDLFALNVRALLRETGWLESDLAERAALCPRTIHRVLRGLHTHAQTQNQIALAFGLGLGDFYPCRPLRHHTPDEILALYRALHAPPQPPEKPGLWKTLRALCALRAFARSKTPQGETTP